MVCVSQWHNWLRRQYGELEICGSNPGYDTNFSLKNYLWSSHFKFYHIFTLFLYAVVPNLNFIGLIVFFIYELFYCFFIVAYKKLLTIQFLVTVLFFSRSHILHLHASYRDDFEGSFEKCIMLQTIIHMPLM